MWSSMHPCLPSHSAKWRFLLDCFMIGFGSGFSQCVNYMHFNENYFCFRWQEDTRMHANPNTKTCNLVLLYDLRYLMGIISSMMTKHVVVQCRLHRFAYLIIWIILCYQLWFTHTIPPLYFSSTSPAPELNTGNIALAETTLESLLVEKPLGPVSIDPIKTSYRLFTWRWWRTSHWRRHGIPPVYLNT